MEAQVDSLVDPIYKSGLADAYKCTWLFMQISCKSFTKKESDSMCMSTRLRKFWSMKKYKNKRQRRLKNWTLRRTDIFWKQLNNKHHLFLKIIRKRHISRFFFSIFVTVSIPLKF